MVLHLAKATSEMFARRSCAGCQRVGKATIGCSVLWGGGRPEGVVQLSVSLMYDFQD